MAVTFTSNIGLAKPDDTELAKNWATATQLADDNNVIISAKTNIAVQTYSPAFIAQTVNPDTGNGTRRGEFQEYQGFIIGNFVIRMIDPGVATGTGEYGVSLPVPIDTSFHATGTSLTTLPGGFSCIGEGYISDGSITASFGTLALDAVVIAGVTYARMIFEAFASKTSALVRDGMPFAIATSDFIGGSFYYKKA
jgi:hypothetical protein